MEYLGQGVGSGVHSSFHDGVELVPVGARPRAGVGKIKYAGAERVADPAKLARLLCKFFFCPGDEWGLSVCLSRPLTPNLTRP